MALNFIKSKPQDVYPFLTRLHIENQTNCTLHGIDEYPDWFTTKPPRYDFVIYCSIITMYLFLAIAIVCDEYCVPAVERVVYNFDMSYDVAGATIMAVATSSPEFFINLYATFLTEGDMGLGTIQGSSVFNTLAITACCCLYTGVDFSIDWWPITRDLLWYSYAVLLLTCFLWDSYIYWYEALILVIAYLLNTTNLIMDRTCQEKFRNRDEPCKFKCFIPRGEVMDFNKMPEPEDDEKPFDFREYWHESYWQQFIWLASYPLECMFFVTIPNVRRRWGEYFMYLSLFMSIVWISILIYLCSWSITVIGYHLLIPDSVMGLVILAAGTSIPEAISSVIVTRKGYGSMAVCNAIGSNTVDILVCLGVPWLFKSFYLPVEPHRPAVSIISEGLYYSSACLLISAILLYIAFMCTRFQLGIPVGIICFTLYIVYVIIAVSIEMSFYDTDLPHCAHKQRK